MSDRTSFRDRVSAALFDDFLVRGDDENERMIAEIKRLRAIEARLNSIERGEIHSFPATAGRRDLAADVAASALRGEA